MDSVVATNGIEYRYVENSDERESICRTILSDLPEWFGIPASTKEYCLRSRELNFLVAFNGGIPIGFVSSKENNRSTVEIYVMGVIKEYQRRGIGFNLSKKIEEQYRQKGFRLLEVKTLDESRPSVEYEKTRKYYEKCGFLPLETVPEIWGEDNPCLIMVKVIGT